MEKASQNRETLLNLITQIYDSVNDHGNRYLLIKEFEQFVPESGRYLEDLCGSDYSMETILDMCLGMAEAESILSRAELTNLVTQIISGTTANETEAESLLRVIAFQYNCKHPAGSDLIFYPDEVFGTADPSVEMIVNAALSTN